MWTTKIQGEEAEEEEEEEVPTGLAKMIRIVWEGNKYKAALVQVVEWNFKLYVHLK